MEFLKDRKIKRLESENNSLREKVESLNAEIKELKDTLLLYNPAELKKKYELYERQYNTYLELNKTLQECRDRYAKTLEDIQKVKMKAQSEYDKWLIKNTK